MHKDEPVPHEHLIQHPSVSEYYLTIYLHNENIEMD